MTFCIYLFIIETISTLGALPLLIFFSLFLKNFFSVPIFSIGMIISVFIFLEFALSIFISKLFSKYNNMITTLKWLYLIKGIIIIGLFFTTKLVSGFLLFGMMLYIITAFTGPMLNTLCIKSINYLSQSSSQINILIYFHAIINFMFLCAINLGLFFIEKGLYSKLILLSSILIFICYFCLRHVSSKFNFHSIVHNTKETLVLKNTFFSFRVVSILICNAIVLDILSKVRHTFLSIDMTSAYDVLTYRNVENIYSAAIFIVLALIFVFKKYLKLYSRNFYCIVFILGFIFISIGYMALAIHISIIYLYIGIFLMSSGYCIIKLQNDFILMHYKIKYILRYKGYIRLLIACISLFIVTFSGYIAHHYGYNTLWILISIFIFFLSILYSILYRYRGEN